MKIRAPRFSAVALPTLLLCMGATWGCSGPDERAQEASLWTGGGNANAGRAVIRNYGCNNCHTIPGVPGARGLVGPSLDGLGERTYIAGELPNNPVNLMRWIRYPHQVEPHTAMPDMNVSEGDSRDIAAYLYTLR